MWIRATGFKRADEIDLKFYKYNATIGLEAQSYVYCEKNIGRRNERKKEENNKLFLSANECVR